MKIKKLSESRKINESVQMTNDKIVDILEKSSYTSFVVDEGDYIKIQGTWRPNSRKCYNDYVGIDSLLNKKLGNGNFDLVYEENTSRDNGNEFSCKLRLNLKQLKEAWYEDHLDIMQRKTSGYDKCYKIVKKARTSNPIDTNALEDACDHFGYDLYKMCLDDVLKEMDNLDEELEFHTYKITFSTKANPDKEQTTMFKTWHSDVEYAWRKSPQNIPHTKIKSIELVENLDEEISNIEPTVKFQGKSSHTFTKDKKWEVDFDEQGNILARTRHGKTSYFKGHINDKVSDFPSTDEDNIILAARKQHSLKFGNGSTVTEAFKPSDSGIQSVKCYNRYNYTIQELRIDNDNQTFERGHFTAGKADKKTKNRQEFEDVVDSLKALGYTEIKSDYHSMRNKTRKGVVQEDASYEWKPNTSFKHIKDIYNKVKANNYQFVNNEREEFMAAVKKADNKGYKPEERKQIRDWHREIWSNNRNKGVTEDMDDYNISGYTEITSKSVPDYDGFNTDYTMYRDDSTGEYVFVFGDKDLYRPEDGNFDWTCETEQRAWEWFNSYNGFEDELYENTKLTNNQLKESGWSHFRFTSGANPYIAKTPAEVKRIKKRYGNAVKLVDNKGGIDYYVINDSRNTDLFSPGIDEEDNPVKESLLQDIKRDHDAIKTKYGKETYNALNQYVELGNDLGDVLYKESEWNKFVKWLKKEKNITVKSPKSDELFESRKERHTMKFKLVESKNTKLHESNNSETYSLVAKHFGYHIRPEANEVMADLVDRALDNIGEDGDIYEAVANAIDEGLIYNADIWTIKQSYEDAELSNETYEALTIDLINIVSSMVDTDGEEEDLI